AANLQWAKWNPKPNQRSVKKPGGRRRRSQKKIANTVLNGHDICQTPTYVADLDTENTQIFGNEF
ncbi:12686_t:CDS:1, partial [Ambispora gerdemannii]